MKFVAIADQHGYLPEIKEADVLLVGGDIVPLDIQTDFSESKAWFKNVFIPWANSLSIKEVICVAGNHDFWLERYSKDFKDLLKGTKIHYLENEVYALGDGDIEIFGSPLCKPFGRWAFMPSIENQKERYFSNIVMEGKKKIFLTHDSPYSVSDIVLQKTCAWYDGKSHLGNPALTHLVERIKPDLMLHGHLHTTNHEPEFLGKTEVRCVSILDENYDPFFEPYYFEL